MEFFVNPPVAGINAAIPYHFIMLFGDMPDKTFYESHNGDCFFNIRVIFMAVVMEGDKVAIIFINPGGGNHRASEITPDVFYNSFRFAFVWLCVDIESIFVIPVAAGLGFFKRGANPGFHFIEQGGPESITEESIVKVGDVTPETVVAVTAF